MSTTDLAQLGVAAAAAIVIVVRAFVSRGRPRPPASRWLTWVLLLTVAALLAGWPPLMRALAGDGGGLIALRVVQHWCVLGMALAFLAFAEHTTRTSAEQAHRIIRPAFAIAGAAGVVMGVAATVGASNLPDAPTLHLLTPAYATSPVIAVYLVAYALPLGLTSVEVGVRCGAVARAAGHILFRTAMAFFLAGCAAGAVYSALRIVGTIVTAVGGTLDAASISFAVTLAGIVCVLVGAGLIGANRTRR